MITPELMVCLRHGKTKRNEVRGHGTVFYSSDKERKKVKQLRTELDPLVDEGIRQAHATGSGLSGEFENFDVIYASCYARAQQTAGIVGRYLGNPPIIINDYLRERSSGWTFNATKKEARTWFPFLKKYWSETSPFLAQPPGGESFADMMLRVDLALRDIMTESAGKRVLVVSHGGTMRVIRKIMELETIQQFEYEITHHPIPNCGTMVYEPNPDKSSLQKMILASTPYTVYYSE